jgi:ABC-2 type transport system permease protein
MAVYKRTYTRYTGPVTSERWRFLILPRYALRSVFETRFALAACLLALVPHLIALVLIYLRGNIDGLLAVGLSDAGQALNFISVDGSFFLTVFTFETVISFFLVALVGPGLISPDLANNALPLYLSRPFSRAEYVLGKLSVLMILTGLITWVPGLILFAVQTSMAGVSWAWDNQRIFWAILLSSWIWTLTISLIALALSAWVKWKTVAAAALFGIFFVAAGFGTVSNALLQSNWGTLLSLAAAMRMIQRWLFLGESAYRNFFPPFGTMPNWTGLLPMIFVCAMSLLLLSWKVRPVQVVR